MGFYYPLLEVFNTLSDRLGQTALPFLFLKTANLPITTSAINLYCDTMSRIYGLFNKGLFPLLEPSVPSLRSYGSMRSW